MNKYQQSWAYNRQKNVNKNKLRAKISCFFIIFLAISAFLPVKLAEDDMADQIIASDYKPTATRQFEALELKSAGIFTVYAYNSVPEQTDSSPCISADGLNICERFANGENLCASNDFKIGTLVRIEGIIDCRIVDRMRSDYIKKIDVFMGYDIDKAKKFGKKSANVYILE